jgi:hypothetical protein
VDCAVREYRRPEATAFRWGDGSMRSPHERCGLSQVAIRDFEAWTGLPVKGFENFPE